MILKPAALLAAIVAVTLAGSAFAADPVNIEIMAVEEEPGRMVLTISAVDEEGKPFPGLNPSSFNAWINDTALIVRQLQTATDRQPASVLLLVDVSTSMAGDPLQQAQAAINEFIDILEPNDEVAVMAFSDSVRLVQDFTADRTALDAAVANLTLTDSTALYDGVIEAAARMTQVERSRKLIVLLSDGLANINQGARDASIQAARDAGVSFISVGLGANTDRQYLTELTGASGGDFIEAATPAELRAAYTRLAFAIRSQYTLVTEVPRSIDRTVAGTLKVHVIHRADNAFAERTLDPLEGASPPPFRMALDGIAAGDRHNGAVELFPSVEEGIEVVKVDYILDDQVVHTTDGVGSYTLDASLLENGSHVIKVVATDAQGREGEVQVPFVVPVLVAPSEGGGLPILPLLLLAVLAVGGYFAFKFGRKRWLEITTPTYSRVDTWASIRVPGGGQKAQEWSDEDAEHPLSRTATPAAAVEDVVQGRVVIMDEAAVRGGELETIQEFEMKSLPLTFGSGPKADMRVEDAGGLIAAEEARIWVQRGRLVYHKLTTLSAMATEGVTAGWQFLDDGDEMRIGPYRLIFQSQQEEEVEDVAEPLPQRLPQEHGMELHRSFGLTETDRSPDLRDWPAAEGPGAPADASSEAVDLEAGGNADSPGTSASWGNWGQSGDPGGAEPASSWETAPSEPKPGVWDIASSSPGSGDPDGEDDADEPEAEASEPEPRPASAAWEVESPQWEANLDDEAKPEWEVDATTQPEQWGPTLLEPKSADWLVEQSQPVDQGAGQVVQPDAWSTFVSAEDDEAAAGGEDGAGAEADDEDRRAWGT